MSRVISFVMSVAGIVILANIVYFGLGWIKDGAGAASVWIIGVLMLGAYIALLKYEAGYPELHMEDPNSPILKLPEVGPTLKSGLHFPVAGGSSADLEPDDRGAFTGALGVLGDAVPGFHPGDPASAERLVPWPRWHPRAGRSRLRRSQGRSDCRGAQHDRCRHCDLDGGHHRWHGDPDRHRSGVGRGRRTDLRGQPAADAGPWWPWRR